MKRITLRKAIEVYLAQHIETTRDSYKYELWLMRDFVSVYVTYVDEVNFENHLVPFASALDQRPSIESPVTYNKYLKTVGAFFNWCVEMGYCEHSPAKGLRRKRVPKQSIGRHDAMPEPMYERLVDYVKWKPRGHALVLFLGDTGCRIGGAAGLQWSDVDLKNMQATVTEKGTAPRLVFFGEECRDALKKWLKKWNGAEGDYVFQVRGKAMKNKSLATHFRRLCERAEIDRDRTWGPHSLRHRKGFQLADAGVSPNDAKNILGHSSVLITLTYYYPDDMVRAEKTARLLHYRAKPKKVKNIMPFGRKAQ